MYSEYYYFNNSEQNMDLSDWHTTIKEVLLKIVQETDWTLIGTFLNAIVLWVVTITLPNKKEGADLDNYVNNLKTH